MSFLEHPLWTKVTIMMRTFLRLTEKRRHVGNRPISAIYLKIGSAFKRSLSSSFKKTKRQVSAQTKLINNVQDKLNQQL